jgi:hypothetical protein
MRVLKQTCLTTILLFIALNMVRLGRAPAQVGPQAMRNGDVDCDGQINITDALSTLNWLFSDGPEPCAIAQTEPCCTQLQEEVTTLRATVEALSARVPSPRDIVLIETPAISGTQPLFTVPEDKWFVVTSLLWDFGSFGPILRKVVNGVSTDIPRGQILNSYGEISQSWAAGVPFPPGSRVPVFTSLGSEDPRSFRLNGYLVGE